VVGYTAGPPDAAFTWIERHASRILLVGALVAANVLIVNLAAHLRGPSAGLTAMTVGLTLALLLLLHRLARRMMGFAVRVGRHQRALSGLMMQAVERFAHEPAGVRGSMDALAACATAGNCSVYVWEAAERTLWAPGTGERVPLTVGMARQMVDGLTQRRPVLVPDVRVTGVLPAHVAGRDGSRAAAIVPMWAGSDLIGLVLRRYADARELQRAGDLPLVSGLAALGAVAIGKALVVDSEAQRLRDNELLLRSVHLASEDAQREMLAGYANEAAEALGVSRSAIYALSGGQLSLVGAYGIPSAITMTAARISLRSELVAMVQRTPGAAVSCRPAHVDPDAAAALAPLGLGAHVTLQPVSDASGLTGLIAVQAAPGSPLEQRERSLLAAVARQVAMSVERARMMHSISKRSRHLACTPKLARSLTGQRDSVAVARIAARELHSGFGFERISVALVQDDAELRIVASAGMLARSGEHVEYTPVMRMVHDSLRPYVSCLANPDVGETTKRAPDPDAPSGCRSQIVVPIVGTDNRCVGVIAVYERDPDSLGEDDLHMLQTVADQLSGTIEQSELFDTLERSYFKTVEALSAALEAKDAYTLDHARSITEMSATVGRRLGMRDGDIRDLKLGALLHDIGKIGVPGEILNKPGPLDEHEFSVMKEHTVIGEQIIAPIEFLEGVRPLVLHEHERWDGRGYPHGLEGDAIPLGARIIFVCDSWHAMTSDRPYRKALPEAEARRRLHAGAGSVRSARGDGVPRGDGCRPAGCRGGTRARLRFG